jgi:hypothetical protein
MAAETFLFVLFFWWLQKKRTGPGKEKFLFLDKQKKQEGRKKEYWAIKFSLLRYLATSLLVPVRFIEPGCGYQGMVKAGLSLKF